MQIVVTNSKGGCGKSTVVASLANILECDIIDYDNQGTLTHSSSLTGLNKPVEVDQATKRIVIHDTLPYNSIKTKSLMKEADLVIIPCKVMYPDLLAVKAVIDNIRALNMKSRSIILFNDVRKPHNNTYREVKSYYFDNYKDIKKAKTEFSSINGFANVLVSPLKGQALREVKTFIEELNIIYKYER